MKAAVRELFETSGGTTHQGWAALGYQFLGVLIAIGLWELIDVTLVTDPQFRHGFSPINTAHKFIGFFAEGAFTRHALPSLRRVGIGLFLAALIGIPLGLLIGYFARIHQITNAVFQFMRTTSPLAWMPIAVICFGVGDKPVCFLLAVAAIWPIVINTAHGVRSVDPVWVKVVRTLGGHDADVLRRVIIPAVIPDMLTGLRISLGVCWIVLVPAEMLGVSSGLGYYILDTRDRFDYGELMAVILIVGILGFLSDTVLAILQRRWSWRTKNQEINQR
jgi:NitT/TauT family transport system permease protein